MPDNFETFLSKHDTKVTAPMDLRLQQTARGLTAFECVRF